MGLLLAACHRWCHPSVTVRNASTTELILAKGHRRREASLHGRDSTSRTGAADHEGATVEMTGWVAEAPLSERRRVFLGCIQAANRLPRPGSKGIIMRVFTTRMAVAAATGALIVGGAGPAGAAQSPNDNATCLGKVFQAQAVDEPRTVSNRILEIREFYLEGTPFGQALKPLAHDTAEGCP
jgi:hypothetical protein